MGSPPVVGAASGGEVLVNASHQSYSSADLRFRELWLDP